jgi:hypothetical protein
VNPLQSGSRRRSCIGIQLEQAVGLGLDGVQGRYMPVICRCRVVRRSKCFPYALEGPLGVLNAYGLERADIGKGELKAVSASRGSERSKKESSKGQPKHRPKHRQ